MLTLGAGDITQVGPDLLALLGGAARRAGRRMGALAPPLCRSAWRGCRGCEVKAGEPLAPLTSVRVGGPAEALVRPRSPDALVALLRLAREEGVPVTVLGGGANTLVGDGGVPGVTLKLPADLFPEVADVGAEEGRLTLGAGAAIVAARQR